jgi:hypothetical protein
MEQNALRQSSWSSYRESKWLYCLIVVSAANREILGREEANLVKMGKMMVYNVELAAHF